MKRLFAVGRVERHHCPECDTMTEHTVTTVGKLKWGIVEEWQIRTCPECELVSQWRVTNEQIS